MALITEIKTSTKTISHAATPVSIRVVGDSDAVFSLQIIRSSDSNFYDFSTNIFEDDYTSRSRLVNVNPGTLNVNFPTNTSGDTYTIRVFAEPHFDTELSFYPNKLYYSTTVTQSARSTITFSTDASISSVSATSFGSTTGSILGKYSGVRKPIVEIKDQKITVPIAAANFGVSITTPGITNNVGEWDDSALYWETVNYTADGSGSGITSLILTSVDDLYIGMQLSHVDGDFQTVLRAITAIDTSTLTVTLDGVESWDTGEPIRFRAYGSNLIRKAVGVGLKLTYATCRLAQKSTTVHTTITSGTPTNMRVKGAQGVTTGATVRGKFVDNSSSSDACVISTVKNGANSGIVSSATDATINITNGVYDADTSDIKENTILYIDGCSDGIYLSGTISIDKYPLSGSKNIYVDMSKIFTIGHDGF